MRFNISRRKAKKMGKTMIRKGGRKILETHGDLYFVSSGRGLVCARYWSYTFVNIDHKEEFLKNEKERLKNGTR